MKIKKIFNTKNLIAIILIVVVTMSYTHSFNVPLKRNPKRAIDKSIIDMEKQFLTTNEDFIPCLDHKKMNNSVLKEGSFSSYLSVELLNANDGNTYNLNRDFKRNYTAKKSQSDISVSLNHNTPLDINNKLMYNNAYIDIPSVYDKTLEVDLLNFGNRLLSSDLIDSDEIAEMSQKELTKLENTKVNLFVYPGTFGELKEYYLTFINHNLQGILNEKNIAISDTDLEIQKQLHDDSVKEYMVHMSYFDFKYLLLSSVNAFENLINTYDASYNLNMDLDYIHSKLRNYNEGILEKYTQKGFINAKFYINKKGELLALFVDTEKNEDENIKKEEILKLYLLGKENTTDDIFLTVHSLKGKEVLINRNLKKDTNNELLTIATIDGSEFINSTSKYNKKNKNLDYNLNFITEKDNKNINLTGFFEDINKTSFIYNIENLKYNSSSENLSTKGTFGMEFKKPEIKSPTNIIDIFTLNNGEFNQIKERSINSVNKYIPIENLKIMIPTWNIFTQSFKIKNLTI